MKRIKKFFADFKKFISRGNILDLAVALVVGSAFTKIVTSLVNDLIMPLICAIFGSASVNDLYFLLNGAEIYYGKFLQAIIDFLLVAFILFLVLRIVMNASNAIRKGIKELPTRAEKKTLKAEGVNMKDRKAVIKATAELRERNKVVEVKKPTQEELLAGILEELKKQNATKEILEEKVEIKEEPKEEQKVKKTAKKQKKTVKEEA